MEGNSMVTVDSNGMDTGYTMYVLFWASLMANLANVKHNQQ